MREVASTANHATSKANKQANKLLAPSPHQAYLRCKAVVAVVVCQARCHVRRVVRDVCVAPRPGHDDVRRDVAQLGRHLLRALGLAGALQVCVLGAFEQVRLADRPRTCGAWER